MVLAEIGYHLRLEAKDAYRARAFQQAAGELLVSSPDLEALHAASALESIPGVGSSIARVLTELVETGRSSYLDRLRQADPPREPGYLRLDLYQGDLHSHSDWSDGKVPLAAMVAAAAQRGYRYMGVTDHSPRMTVVRGLDPARLRAQRLELREAEQRFGIRVLAGIEVDILEDGALDLADEALAELDVVIASPHIKLRMPEAEMTRRMLRAVAHPEVDVIGHPTGRRPGSRPGADYDVEAVFKVAADRGVVLEIDTDPGRFDLGPELVKLAAGFGCDFALDSDAHSPGEFAYVQLGAWIAESAGLEEARIVNWLDAEALEQRLRGRRRANNRGAGG